MHDIRYALRGFRRSPGVVVTVILTIGLAMIPRTCRAARAIKTALAAGQRSGRLGRMMGWHAFRRLLGARGRRHGWCALGASIADTALSC